MAVPWAAATRAVADACDTVPDQVSLRVQVLAEVARVVPHDAYAWVLTDPVTCVGVAPLASVPDLEDLPRLVRAKYLTDLNRWTTLPTDRPVTLLGATSGRPQCSLWWREVLDHYSVGDVLSLVLRDTYGCWSFLDLWRQRSPVPAGQSAAAFRDEEVAFLRRLQPTLCRAMRKTVARTFATPASATNVPATEGGPVLLTHGDDLRLLAQTPRTDAYLRALLPPGDRPHPVPAAAYNVAAQLLAVEAGVDNHPPKGRVHLRNGHWLTLHAARLSGTGTIAVTVEQTTPHDRVELFAAGNALTARESELLRRLLGGDDTRHLARQMGLSAHTVQDHLKSVFAKTGAHSRPMLVARVLGQ